MIKTMIRQELDYETMLLERLKSRFLGIPDVVLTFSKGGFYYRQKGSSKRIYIKRKNRDLLRTIAANRYILRKVDILTKNVNALNKVLPKLSDYDDETIIKSLPASFKHAIDIIRKENGQNNEVPDQKTKVIQSENPKHREELTINVSNGLKVRSKGEMGIAEALLSYDLVICYEKALKLTEKILMPDGSIKTKEVTIYPDFTIILPDGTEIYWEHIGLFDQPGYRENQVQKFKLYYDNGIYPPKNLIITMEGQDKPFDIMAIRRIIEGVILPLVIQ